LIYFLIPGTSEDDLRETAYEILVASAGAAGYTFDILDKHSINRFMLIMNTVFIEHCTFQWDMCLYMFTINI